MSEALRVLCGDHNCLPSPESNHYTDFCRNHFLLILRSYQLSGIPDYYGLVVSNKWLLNIRKTLSP